MDINWAKIFFGSNFYNRLSQMARTTIIDETIADEAVTFVINRISENNWERCQSYSGRSTPETFLQSICSNLIIDFHRKVYGRERPPTWLKEKGQTWLVVWKELCLDRHATETIISKLTEDGSKDPDTVNNIIQVIKAKLPWCGVSRRPESLDDEEARFELPSTQDEDSDQALYKEINLVFAHWLLNGADQPVETTSLPPETLSKISSAIKSTSLTASELLMLRMYFCDGLSGAKIAQALNIPKHQPVRLIKELLNKLRSLLSE